MRQSKSYFNVFMMIPFKTFKVSPKTLCFKHCFENFFTNNNKCKLEIISIDWIKPAFWDEEFQSGFHGMAFILGMALYPIGSSNRSTKSFIRFSSFENFTIGKEGGGVFTYIKGLHNFAIPELKQAGRSTKLFITCVA